MTLSPLKRSLLLYFVGIFEGIRVTLTPAFSEQLTSGEGFRFTDVEYGLLFIPFSFASLCVSLLVGKWIEKKGLSKPFLVAIIADILSLYFIGMAFVVSFSTFYSFICILVALFLSGIGFGILLPVVTTELSLLYPKKTEIHLIFFYVTLSIGSLLLFLARDFFLQQSAFSILFISVCFILTFIAVNFFDIFSKGFVRHRPLHPYRLFWPLVLAMFLDGMLENVFFNWAQLYATDVAGFNSSFASTLYLGFLIFFSISQIVYAWTLRRVLLDLLFVLVPALLTLTALIASFIFNLSTAFILFCAIGAFLSANLPFLICYCKKMFGVQPLLFGGLIAAYTFGYGMAAFGFVAVEATQNLTILGYFFEITAILAALITVLNMMTVKKRIYEE